jgi:hypothetical protein
MAEEILVDNRHSTSEDIRQAILQRTTRGMLTYNTGKDHRLEGELWAVPSTRGGFHKVDLDEESCDCEDWTFYGSVVGVACRRVYAAALARSVGVRLFDANSIRAWIQQADQRASEQEQGAIHPTAWIPCSRNAAWPRFGTYQRTGLVPGNDQLPSGKERLPLGIRGEIIPSTI